MVCLLVLGLIGRLFPEADKYWLCSIAVQICISATSCVLIRGYSAKLKHEPWTPSISDLRPTFKALLLSNIYWFFVSLGCFLIIPGLFIAARWCLGLCVLVCEKKGPLASLAESNMLTKGGQKMIFRYFAIPLILLFASPIVLAIAGALIFAEMNAPEASNSLKWNLSHLPYVIFGVSIEYLVLIGIFAALGMQIKLYGYLKYHDEQKRQTTDPHVEPS